MNLSPNISAQQRNLQIIKLTSTIKIMLVSAPVEWFVTTMLFQELLRGIIHDSSSKCHCQKFNLAWQRHISSRNRFFTSLNSVLQATDIIRFPVTNIA